ncbi:MAG: hypothetical protein Q7R52_02760 [archaeon]|nr:hypothetical protein [archaeon]
MATKKFSFGSESKEGRNDVKVIGKGEVLNEGCPSCNSKNVEPTGTLYKGNRAYKCFDCENFFASPTSWAKCDNEYIIREKNGLIANDLVMGPDCFRCPIPKKEGFNIHQLIKEGKQCPYFKGPIKFDSAKEIGG